MQGVLLGVLEALLDDDALRAGDNLGAVYVRLIVVFISESSVCVLPVYISRRAQYIILAPEASLSLVNHLPLTSLSHRIVILGYLIILHHG